MRCGKLAIVTDSLTNAEGWQSIVSHTLYLVSATLSALRRRRAGDARRGEREVGMRAEEVERRGGGMR